MPTPAVSISSRRVSPTPSLGRSIDSRTSSPSRSLASRNASDILTGTSPRPGPSTRPGRNRTALRQFYGLAGAEAKGISELEREDFDPDKWVENICQEKGLGELLKIENDLVNEIRGLDGERKSLVYDNYSKLIVATDTIAKMRADLAPLAPTTSTLQPALTHIAQVSSSLVKSLGSAPKTPARPAPSTKKQTVQYALQTPQRLQRLISEGRIKEAEEDRNEILTLLRKWNGVKGVDELEGSIERVWNGGAARQDDAV